MSDASRAPTDAVERKGGGPNFFRYYIREIQDLYSQDEDILSLSLSSQHSVSSVETSPRSKADAVDSHRATTELFSEAVGDGFSDFKKERLKASLKQSVTVLSQEVDEMVDPVLAIYKIKSHMRNKERPSSNPNLSHAPSKKQKISSTPSTTIPIQAGIVGHRSCEEPSINPCKTTCKKRRATEDTDEVEEKNSEVNDELLAFIENGGSVAKDAVKKYSNELSTELEKMEQHLEELLDTVVSKCRQMTIVEKQQLRNLIQNLPPKNLDRVVEIVRRNKLPKAGAPGKEIYIDLDNEDNVTLWRLYYYVEAVASAKKLSS